MCVCRRFLWLCKCSAPSLISLPPPAPHYFSSHLSPPASGCPCLTLINSKCKNHLSAARFLPTSPRWGQALLSSHDCLNPGCCGFYDLDPNLRGLRAGRPLGDSCRAAWKTYKERTMPLGESRSASLLRRLHSHAPLTSKGSSLQSSDVDDTAPPQGWVGHARCSHVWTPPSPLSSPSLPQPPGQLLPQGPLAPAFPPGESDREEGWETGPGIIPDNKC